MIETIEITKLEYYNLLLDTEKLRRLEQAGAIRDFYNDTIYGKQTWQISWDEFEEETKAKVWPREYN